MKGLWLRGCRNRAAAAGSKGSALLQPICRWAGLESEQNLERFLTTLRIEEIG